MKRCLVFMLWFATAGPALAADATVQWARRIELGLGVSGVVKTVAIEAGARVPKGQALVALDETPFKAAFDMARTERDEAARDYKQAKELYDRAVLAKVELENARNKSVRAQARFEEAKYQLERSRIVAPFDAWVLEVRAQPGQSIVNALEARPLVVLAAAGEYFARLQVPAEIVDRLKPGQPVNVTVGGRNYPGKIHALALEPAGGKAEGRHEVVVLFQAAERLRPGRAATVDLP